MKTILSLFLTSLSASAATMYPVLTDNSARTFTGGGTNLALLSGTNTFTGTNTFSAASFYKANSLGFRLLYAAPTNIYISSLSTTADPTNNGDFANITALLQVTLPALLSTNSIVMATCQIERTNANVTAADWYFYAGSNTNYVGAATGQIPTSSGKNQVAIQTPFLVAADSHTQQLSGSFWSSAPLILGPTNFTTTSASFDIYIGARTTTSFTNVFIYGLKIYEAVGN